MNQLLSGFAHQLGGKQAPAAGDQSAGGTPIMPASSGEGGGKPFFQTYVSVLGANVGGGEDTNSESSGSSDRTVAAKGEGKALPGMALAAPLTLENAQEGKASSKTGNEESPSSVGESGKAAESSGETSESGESREGGESSGGEKSSEAKQEKMSENAEGENKNEGESAGKEKASTGKEGQRAEKQGTSAEPNRTLPSGGETAKDASGQASGKKKGEISERPANASARPSEGGPSESSRESGPSQAPEESGQKTTSGKKSHAADGGKEAKAGNKTDSGSGSESRDRPGAATTQKAAGSAANTDQAVNANRSTPAGPAEAPQSDGRAAAGTKGTGGSVSRAAADNSSGSHAGSGSGAPQGGNGQAAKTQAGSRGGTADPGGTTGGKTAPATPRQVEIPDKGSGENRKRQPVEQAKGVGRERNSSKKQSPNRSTGGNTAVRPSGSDRVPAGSRQEGKAAELDPSGSRARPVEQQHAKESGFSGLTTGTNSAVRPEQQSAVGFHSLNRVTEAEREFSPAMKPTQGELNRSMLEMMDTEMSGEREFGGSDDGERGELRKLEALNTSQLRSSSVRQKLSMHIARAVRQELAQSRGGSEAQWQHHRFVLDDGQSVNVSFRQVEGAIQLQLGSGSTEMNKLLQQHLGEIREHLRQELDMDVNLEFQDFEEKQFEGEPSDRPADPRGAGTPVGGERDGDSSPSTAPRQVRYMGFNTNEWTA